MFGVNLTNSSSATLSASNDDQIAPSATWQFDGGPAGQTFWVDGPMGRIGFLDLGDTHIPGDDPVFQWGVLIGYQAMSIVGRYEGQGTLALVVDQFLQVSLSGMSFRQVSLDGLITADSAVAA